MRVLGPEGRSEGVDLANNGMSLLTNARNFLSICRPWTRRSSSFPQTASESKEMCLRKCFDESDKTAWQKRSAGTPRCPLTVRNAGFWKKSFV